MDKDNEDRRRFSRVPFDAQVSIHAARDWEARLVDISLKGALVERPRGWHANAGDLCSLTINLDGAPDLTIRMEAVVVAHARPETVGFQCLHIDIDSVAHLRRLMELNVGDPERMNRELSALGDS